MLKNAYESLRMPLRILRTCCERNNNSTHAYICIHVHPLPVYLFVFYLLGPAQSAYSPLYQYSLSAFFHYTMRISIRMRAKLYKRLTITTNALPLIRMAYELLPNMLRICVFTNFMNLFLKFAKPRERPRMYTNTNECKAVTMRPLRFVTELPRYYVNDTIRNIFAQV